MSTYTYGLEFEVAGISVSSAAHALNRGGIQCVEPNRTHETNANWKAVHDGSVRGAEVVSPILDDSRLNEASKVARILLQAGGKVDRSTGFHVHVGFNSFGDSNEQRLNTLSNFVVNWYAAHATIGTLVAASRLNNSYCKAIDLATAEAYASRIRGGRIGQGDRYQSLNLDAYDRHGTIEIRLHQGTLNGTKAVAWAEFIASMVEYSKTSLLSGGFDSYTERLNNIGTLLTTLTTAGLKDSTAEYLNRRALELQA